MNDSLGDRMKMNYENRQRYYLTRRTPIIVRVDGKAFHTWTKRLVRPFDEPLMLGMVAAAWKTAEELQGFRAAYIQSDEASFLLTDYDKLTTEAHFDYNKSKIESVTASTFTAWFGCRYSGYQPARPAIFDARAFNIPRE